MTLPLAAAWLGRPGIRWTLVLAMSVGALVAFGHVVRAIGRRLDRVPDGEPAGLYVTGIEADLGHAIMLVAMVLMLVAITVDISMTFFRVVFAGLAAAYAVVLMRHIVQARRVPPPAYLAERVAGAAYHLIAALAMLATVVPSAVAGRSGTAISGSMAGMAMAGSRSGGGVPVPGLLGVAAGLFIVDAVFTLWVAVRRRSPGQTGVRLPASIRGEVVPHVVMDVGMGAMLIAAL